MNKSIFHLLCLKLIFLPLVFLGISGGWRMNEIYYFQNKGYRGDKAIYTERYLYPPYLKMMETTNEDIIRYLRLLRNDIFARHGYIFKNEDLREFFEKMEWYEPKSREVELNDIERKNISRIQEVEKRVKSEEELKEGRNEGNYIHKVIFKAKWGDKEGEFGSEIWLGAGDYPKGIVVDNKGIICILDHINNRIQIFNSSGYYLQSIPVLSFIGEGKMTTNGFTYPCPEVHGNKLYIDEDEFLYVPIWKCLNHFVKPKKVFRYTIDGEKEEISMNKYESLLQRWEPKELNTGKYRIKVDGENLIICKETEEKTLKLGEKINFIKLDKYINIWVYLYVNPWKVLVYDLRGKRVGGLELNEDPTLWAPPFIDENGNIWQLRLIENGLSVIEWEFK